MPGFAGVLPFMPEQEQRARPAWLVALDGLCRPCADAEFYGLRKRHARCEHGTCGCDYAIPAEWPAGTWPVEGVH